MSIKRGDQKKTQDSCPGTGAKRLRKKEDQQAETFVVGTSARAALGSFSWGWGHWHQRVASPKRFMRQATRKGAEEEEEERGSEDGGVGKMEKRLRGKSRKD
jgi:hypothetical protein